MSSRTLRTRPRRHRPAAAERSLAAPARALGAWPAWVPAALLVLAIVAVFWQVCAHEFTNWDDGLNVTHNPLLFGQTFAGLLEFWKHPYENEYIPLAYTVWWLLSKLARVDTPDAMGVALNPYVFHTANLLLHVGVCLVACRLLRLLTGHRWPAWVGAMLFALHPLQVEAVAWVTGLKDLLCGLLSLLALWQYVLFARARDGEEPSQLKKATQGWHYAAATAALIGAMLAKPSAVTVPLMAAAIDLWILRRTWRRVAIAVLPWLAIAGVFTLIGLRAQPASRIPVDFGPIWMRPLIAGDTLAFYLGKFLVPLGLSPIYPHSIDRVLSGGFVWVAWLVPVVLAGIAWATRRRAAWVAAAVAIFVAGPLPVLGLVPFEYARISTVADRYVYLGLLGPAIALAFVLSAGPVRRSSTARSIAITAGAILFLLYGGLSFVQAGYWRDSAAVCNRVLSLDPASDIAYSNLAADALVAGRRGEALQFARQAVHFGPKRARNQVTLGIILQQLGRHNEAGVTFLSACQLDPGNMVALTGLADELARAGQMEKAMAIARAAVDSWPGAADPHRCLAELLSRQGRVADALRESEAAVRLDPSDAQCHLTYGRVLEQAGRHAEAAGQFAIAGAIAGRASPPEPPRVQ